MAITVRNKHNLSRVIPSDVKRTIRQHCGFGCVICGKFLYEYEHVDPPFSEAVVHDPARMCLLCPDHHARKTRGTLSVQEVKDACVSPKAKQVGFSHDNEFSRLKQPFKIKLGNWTFNNPKEIIKIDGRTLLAVEESVDGVLTLSGEFYNDDSELILKIDSNEWQASSGSWDVEQTGKKLLIRESTRNRSLTVTIESNSLLIFDDINMRYGDVFFESKNGGEVEIRYKDTPVFNHNPKQKGGAGIETNGYLNISKDGSLAPLEGGVIIGAGTLKIGNPKPVVLVPNRVKIGRNDQCSCGSGKKFKKCCLGK